MRELGADHVIDYASADFKAEVLRHTAQRGVDLVFDSVGKDTFERSVQSLARGGIAVSYGSASGPAPSIAPAVLTQSALSIAGGSVFGFIATPEQLQSRSRSVLEVIQAGWLELAAPASYALKDVSRAHLDLESRKTQGKLMLIP